MLLDLARGLTHVHHARAQLRQGRGRVQTLVAEVAVALGGVPGARGVMQLMVTAVAPKASKGFPQRRIWVEFALEAVRVRSKDSQFHSLTPFR